MHRLPKSICFFNKVKIQNVSRAKSRYNRRAVIHHCMPTIKRQAEFQVYMSEYVSTFSILILSCHFSEGKVVFGFQVKLQHNDTEV